MSKAMQTKDIPDQPILDFLAVTANQPATWFDVENMPSVRKAMPADLPDKLVLSKMKSLIRKGLVKGCACGCRGDFYLNDAESA